MASQKGEIPALLLPTQQDASSRRRSSSVHSGKSDITTVEANWEIANKPAMKRRQTTNVKINNFTWWDMICAMFSGPKALANKLVTKIDFDTQDDEPGEPKESPFILNVLVFHNNSEQTQPAQCTLDTGCLQGNIISEELARELGYAEFEELGDRERNGGTTVLGDPLHPLGAVHLSWYHKRSTLLFKKMRFLVLAKANVDLLVGHDAIVKYNLISWPNLSMGATGIVDIPNPGDGDLQQLLAEFKECKQRVANLRKIFRDKKKKKTGGEDKKLEDDIKKAEIARDLAGAKITLYQTMKAYNALKEKLQAANKPGKNVTKLKKEVQEAENYYKRAAAICQDMEDSPADPRPKESLKTLNDERERANSGGGSKESDGEQENGKLARRESTRRGGDKRFKLNSGEKTDRLGKDPAVSLTARAS